MDNNELVSVIARVIKDTLPAGKKLLVPVGVSARHLHLSREHVDILFGRGYELKEKKKLMGGQFAAEECVTILGSQLTSIENVRILGPIRSKTQVELSKTDAVKLKIAAPIRESGKIEGSAPITIVGPKGSITLSEGCIIASRHIHMSPEDASRFGLKDNDRVSVKVPGIRGGVFDSVKVRVHKTFTLEMHIDTDEANAMDIKTGSILEVLI